MNLPSLSQTVPTDQPIDHWQASLRQVACVVFCVIQCADGRCEHPIRESVDNQQFSGSQMAQMFSQLTRNSRWRLIHEQPLSFPTFHPQGLTRANGKYFLSTVQVYRKSSISPDSDSSETHNALPGKGHLIVFDDNGEKLQSIQLGEAALFHPGGIDRDDQYIWVPVAEYRPDSRTIIYRVKIDDLQAEEVLRLDDHIGAVIRDSLQQRLIGFSWGARRIYIWPLDDRRKVITDSEQATVSPVVNPQHFIDYQDCQSIGDGFALCSGLANYNLGNKQARVGLGGVDLWDLRQMRPIHLLPVALQTDRFPQRAMTQNPFYADVCGGNLRFHFIPEDDTSNHYIYEAQQR
jgi:hypothetical protein